MEQIVINGFIAFFVVTWLSIIGLTLLIFVIIEILLSKMETEKYYENAKEREADIAKKRLEAATRTNATVDAARKLAEAEEQDKLDKIRDVNAQRENEFAAAKATDTDG